MLKKCFARALLGKLPCMSQDRLEMSVLLHQFGGSFVTNSPHARHVIRRVTNKRQIVGDKFGSNSESLIRVFVSYPMLLDICGPTTAWVQQPDSRFHQLLKILVTCYHYHIDSCLYAS